jgi:hypothetical protein
VQFLIRRERIFADGYENAVSSRGIHILGAEVECEPDTSGEEQEGEDNTRTGEIYR